MYAVMLYNTIIILFILLCIKYFFLGNAVVASSNTYASSCDRHSVHAVRSKAPSNTTYNLSLGS